jgi:ubiquinone/menaquinone biosynthesis C-methylase UbiE
MKSLFSWLKRKNSHIDNYTGIFGEIQRGYFQGNMFNVGYWEKDSNNLLEASFALIEKTLGNIEKPPKKIADIACGLGGPTNFISKKFIDATVTGINLHPSQVKYCEAAYPQCTFKVMDATKLNFKANELDLIVSIEAAFHFNSRKAFLKECFRTLKKGGSLRICDELLTNDIASNYLYNSALNEINYVENIGEYEKLLSQIGFKNIEIRDVTENTILPWSIDFANWLKEQLQDNLIDEHHYNQWIQIIELTKKNTISYVLVKAEK